MAPAVRAHHVITTLLTAWGGYVGYLTGMWSAELLTSTSDTLNRLFLTGAGLGIGFLGGYGLKSYTQHAWDRLQHATNRIPSEVTITTVLGGTIGLAFAVMLNLLLERIPGYGWTYGLLTGVISMLLFTTLAVKNRAAFRGPGMMMPIKPDTILDTSAIIDGRIQSVLACGLSDKAPAVPTRVINELKALADHANPGRKARGQRGLSNLEHIRDAYQGLSTLNDRLGSSVPTDTALAELALEHDATLLTVDFTLSRTARIRGAKVINLNELSHALRPHYGTGDHPTVSLEGPGNDTGQAIGHLDDGTLVVARDAHHLIGQTRLVRIYNTLERVSGRILFAEDAGAADIAGR
jgi:uncharacterized protein YacL